MRLLQYSTLAIAALLCSMPPGVANAADPPSAVIKHAPEAQQEWSFRASPYGWLPSMNGTQTVRGRSVDVDATFIEIARKSDTLVGLMIDLEARNGRWALLGDAVWMKVGLNADKTRTVSPAPGVPGTVGASLGLDVRMAIVEFGAAYEMARSGALALDVLAGGRYWRQEASASFDVTGTADLGDLTISESRAISRSGVVNWVDPLVGGRVRYDLAPGQHLMFRADVGGFGVGSRTSWQAIGAYGFDFAVRERVTYSGMIGYRALSVDYSKGSGRNQYAFDMLQHGPVIGLNIRY